MVRRARAQSPGPVDDPSPETGSLRQLERQSFNLSNLMEISREINGTLRLDDLCTIIILTVMGQSGAQKAVLYVRDDEEYVVRAARGLAEGLVLPSLPVDPVFAQTAVQRDGVFPVSACAFVDGSLETRLVSLLSGKLVVPFVNKGQCLAFLLLGERYPDQDWNEDEIGFLASIADMGSMALANARLFGELEKKLGQLSGLYEISRVINGSSEVGEILRLAGETLGTGFGVNRAVFLGLAGHDLVFLSGIGIEGIRAGSTMTPLFESVFTLEQALVIEDRSGNPELSAVFGEGVLEESNMALLVPLVAAGERVASWPSWGWRGAGAGPSSRRSANSFRLSAPSLLLRFWWRGLLATKNAVWPIHSIPGWNSLSVKLPVPGNSVFPSESVSSRWTGSTNVTGTWSGISAVFCGTGLICATRWSVWQQLRGRLCSPGFPCGIRSA